LRVLSLEEEAFGWPDVMPEQFVKLDGVLSFNGDHTRGPDQVLQRDLVHSAAARQEMNRPIDVGPGMRPHPERRDRANVSSFHMHEVPDLYAGVIWPMNHPGVDWDRNIDPFI
jgi:hypothetical protein